MEGPKGLKVSGRLQMRLKTSSAISKPKLRFQSGCHIIKKTWSKEASGPTSPEHSKVLSKGIRVHLAEPSLGQQISRVSCKSSPPHLQLGPSGHSMPGKLPFLSATPRNVASSSSHILTGCFSAATLATLRGFP